MARGEPGGPYRAAGRAADERALTRLRSKSRRVARRFAVRRRREARWHRVAGWLRRSSSGLIGLGLVVIVGLGLGYGAPDGVRAATLAGVIGGLMAKVFALGRHS